jgi:hypothetical protein
MVFVFFLIDDADQQTQKNQIMVHVQDVKVKQENKNQIQDVAQVIE